MKWQYNNSSFCPSQDTASPKCTFSNSHLAMLLLYTQFIDFPTDEEIEFDLSAHNSQGFANGVRA